MHLQVSMPWNDLHDHRFLICNEQFGARNRGQHETNIHDESRITLQKAARLANGRFRYEYDFGDNWQHDIVIEKESPWENGSLVPVCLEGAYGCPPEDWGALRDSQICWMRRAVRIANGTWRCNHG